MKEFKSVGSVCLTALIALSFLSCSTGQGGQTGAEVTVSLSSDRSSILADNTTAATFTVVDNSTSTDVTAQSVIYLSSADGNTALTTNAFSTGTPGSYTFYAEYNGVRSQDISIRAIDLDQETIAGISLHVSKTRIYSDGGDFAVFTLKDADGNDVTDLGQFFVDGKPIEGNRFGTKEGSLTPRTVSAEIGSIKIPDTESVTASSSVGFTPRALLEEITRTNCQYCPTMIKVISELAADDPQLVVAYNVHNTVSTVYQNQMSETSQNYVKAFCDFINVGANVNEKYTAAPRSFLNRSTDDYSSSTPDLANVFRNAALSGPADVAVSMWSTSSASSIELNAAVGSKKDFTGRIVAVLVDNGIDAEQEGMGNIRMYRVMKAYYPDVEGQAASFTAGSPFSFKAEFDLNATPVTAVGNCELIVFVTDDTDGLCEIVQFARVGEAKGY